MSVVDEIDGNMIPLFLTLFFIGFSKRLNKPAQKGLRAQVTRNQWWKLQFVCHPFIIGGLVYYASLSKTSLQKLVCSLLIIPTAFNWGVEPFDLPSDGIFQFFFFLHHVAPIAAVLLPTTDVVVNGDVIAQALLFGHAWMLHPIDTLAYYKVLDKQRLFWWYISLGVLLKANYWRCSYDTLGTDWNSAFFSL